MPKFLSYPVHPIHPVQKSFGFYSLAVRPSLPEGNYNLGLESRLQPVGR